METSGGSTTLNWTEEVEDLLHSGELDQAISLLESIVSSLESQSEREEIPNEFTEKSPSSVDFQLSTALEDLSKIYSAKGFSDKADRALDRALQIKHRQGSLPVGKGSISDEFSQSQISEDRAISAEGTAERGYDGSSSNFHDGGNELKSCDDDDWEAMADRAPEELLSPQSLPKVSKLSLEDSKTEGTRRRGRGKFSGNTRGLYSDNQSDEPAFDDPENSSVDNPEDPDKRNLTYGTHHVLVLADLPLSTRTTDLERLLGKFKDLFVIRWVNDTTSLAVFKTPSLALEAIKSTQCPFTVRILDENDELLSSIPQKDLQPHRPRPQTSARTAQRLIAQELGIKLPSNFGSAELKKQEAARKNRIISRQNMRNDAWGDDGTK